MKSFYKVIVCAIAFVVFVFGDISANVFAQEKSTLVASINIENLMIVERVGDTFTISFDITNGKSLQTDVRYAVVLRNIDNSYVVDQVVYDDALTILENSKVNKHVSYTPPVSLSGTYNLFITANNGAGFPFGTAFVAPIQIFTEKQGVFIAPEACVIDGKPITQAVAVTKQTNLLLKCTIVNNSADQVSVTPFVSTWSPDLFGVAEQNTITETPVLLTANQKKDVTITIPLVNKPGIHTATIKVGESNTIFIKYSVSGMVASVRSASLDADRYKKGSSAVASVVWSVVNSTTNRVTLESRLKSAGGFECADSVSQIFSLGQLRSAVTEVPFVVSKQCFDPILFISIKDGSGTILDESSFSFETQSSPLLSKISSIILLTLLVVIAGIIIVFKIKRRGEEIGGTSLPSRGVMTFAMVILGGTILLFPSSVHAFSYLSGVDNDVTTTITMQTSFGPDVPVTATAEISSTATHTVSLTATNNGQTPRTTLVSNGIVSPGNNLGIYNFSFRTPTTEGTYAVNFETGVNTQFVYVKVVEVSNDSGYISLECGGSVYSGIPNSEDYPYSHGTYRAEFYEDPQATIPMDVSGLNFKLRQEHAINIPAGVSSTPGSETVLIPVASGTSYTYTSGFDYGYTLGYGDDSCDQMVEVYGYGTLEGSDLTPTGYMLIPELPIVNMSAPGGSYQNEQFNITWNSQNATSCTGTGFNTGGNTSGSVAVSQSSATTYSVTCSNVLGNDSASRTVSDWGPLPPPVVSCNQWPGMAVECDAPNMCDADPVHSGFEICVP